MPRIRTVKPDLWTDSKVVGLSLPARLMFIGSWNFADDYGCLPADAVQLKLRVLPADSCDPGVLVGELLEAGLFEELVSAGGERFWHVTHWTRHQRVSNPSTSEYGDPTTWKQASTRGFAESSGANTEDSGGIVPLRKGREGKGEEGKGMEIAPKPARNEVWDTLQDLFGEPTTTGNRSLRGKLVKSLTTAGATGEEIRRRVAVWPHHFENATLTETALEKHWDRLGRPPARVADVDRFDDMRREQERSARAAELDAEARGLPG